MRKMLKKGALLSTLLFGLLSCEKDIIELNTPVESTQTTEEKPTDDKLGVSKELFLNVLYGESSTLTKKPSKDGFVSNFELDKAYYSKNEQVEVLSVPVKSWGSTKISFLSVNQNKKKNQYVLVYPDTTNDKLFYVCTIEGKIIKRVVIDEFGVGHDTYLDGSRKTGRIEFCQLDVYVTCSSEKHCYLQGNAGECSYWRKSGGSPPRTFTLSTICENSSGLEEGGLPSIGIDGGGIGGGGISIPPTQGGGSSQGFECAPGFNCLENQRNVQFQELMARLSQQEEHFLNSKTDIKNRLSFYLPTENIQEFTLFTKKLLDLIKTTENNPDTKVTEAVLFDIFSYKSFFSNATFEQCFTMAIINEMASSLTNDPVELYLLLRHKNPKYFDVAAFSKGGESIIVGEYTLTPHYDNDQNVVFYTAGRQQGAQLKNDIEYVVKPQGLQNFINRIDLYTASANIFYLNGIPNQGQIALAAGDYVEGLTKMWGEALHSAEWWAYAITTMGHFTINNTVPKIDKTLTSFTKISDESLGKMIGILRDVKKGKGNFGVGSANRMEAEIMGKAWLGNNFKESIRTPGVFVSADGLRQYRFSFKPKLGIYQANFESRNIPSGGWINNGHLNIVD